MLLLRIGAELQRFGLAGGARPCELHGEKIRRIGVGGSHCERIKAQRLRLITYVFGLDEYMFRTLEL